MLTFSASGASTLVVLEPCTAEQAGQEDSACAPTCLTCGCCAQPVEPAGFSATSSASIPRPAVIAFIPRLTDAQTRDVLHVPKLHA